jgi:hypothetical protein
VTYFFVPTPTKKSLKTDEKGQSWLILWKNNSKISQMKMPFILRHPCHYVSMSRLLFFSPNAIALND